MLVLVTFAVHCLFGSGVQQAHPRSKPFLLFQVRLFDLRRQLDMATSISSEGDQIYPRCWVEVRPLSADHLLSLRANEYHCFREIRTKLISGAGSGGYCFNEILIRNLEIPLLSSIVLSNWPGGNASFLSNQI